MCLRACRRPPRACSACSARIRTPPTERSPQSSPLGWNSHSRTTATFPTRPSSKQRCTCLPRCAACRTACGPTGFSSFSRSSSAAWHTCTRASCASGCCYRSSVPSVDSRAQAPHLRPRRRRCCRRRRCRRHRRRSTPPAPPVDVTPQASPISHPTCAARRPRRRSPLNTARSSASAVARRASTSLALGRTPPCWASSRRRCAATAECPPPPLTAAATVEADRAPRAAHALAQRACSVGSVVAGSTRAHSRRCSAPVVVAAGRPLPHLLRRPIRLLWPHGKRSLPRTRSRPPHHRTTASAPLVRPPSLRARAPRPPRRRPSSCGWPTTARRCASIAGRRRPGASLSAGSGASVRRVARRRPLPTRVWCPWRRTRGAPSR